MKLTILVLGFFSIKDCISEILPVKLDLNHTDSNTCSTTLPSKSVIEKFLEDEVTPYLNDRYGNVNMGNSKTDGWKNVVNLNMSSRTTQCPIGWVLSNNTGVRGCGRNGNKRTSSATFPINNIMYTQVRGSVCHTERYSQCFCSIPKT